VRERRRRSDCPVHFALEVFGDRWSLLIVRDLMFKGKSTFGELLASEEGIATNVLTDALARLESAGVVHKAKASGRSKYSLTEMGVDLVPMMLELIRWGARNDPRSAADLDFVAEVELDRDKLHRRLTVELSPTQPPPTEGAT
jgi:DNA-binding HxlR family transcriptional regulator